MIKLGVNALSLYFLMMWTKQRKCILGGRRENWSDIFRRDRDVLTSSHIPVPYLWCSVSFPKKTVWRCCQDRTSVLLQSAFLQPWPAQLGKEEF